MYACKGTCSMDMHGAKVCALHHARAKCACLLAMLMEHMLWNAMCVEFL